MSKPVIQVENLSKQFIIAHETTERYKALRDIITRKATDLVSKNRAAKTTKDRKSVV